MLLLIDPLSPLSFNNYTMRLCELIFAAPLILLVSSRSLDRRSEAGQTPDPPGPRPQQSLPDTLPVQGASGGQDPTGDPWQPQEVQKNKAGRTPAQERAKVLKAAETRARNKAIKAGEIPAPPKAEPKPDGGGRRVRSAESEAVRLASFYQTIEEKRAARAEELAKLPKQPSKTSKRKPLTEEQKRIKAEKHRESVARNKRIKEGLEPAPNVHLGPHRLRGVPKNRSPEMESRRLERFKETIKNNKEANAERAERRKRLKAMTPEEQESELKRVSDMGGPKEMNDEGMDKPDEENVESQDEPLQNPFKMAAPDLSRAAGAAWEETLSKLWGLASLPFLAVPHIQRMWGTLVLP